MNGTETWRVTGENKKYGVAVCNIDSLKQHHLQILIGETVQIIKEHEGWFYGCRLKDKCNVGIFPAISIYLKEATVSKVGNYETIQSSELPIIQETTSVLREWNEHLKNLYRQSNRAELSNFERIWKMMRELIEWRKLLIERKMTQDEMSDLQQKCANKIDCGNAMLRLDLVVRGADGIKLQNCWGNSVLLFRQHLSALQRIKDEEDTESAKKTQRKSAFNIFLSLEMMNIHLVENVDVLVSLYDSDASKFISENFIVKLGHFSQTKEPDSMHSVLFTDLGQYDAERSHVWLVCQFIRIGTMMPSDSIDDGRRRKTRGLRRPYGIAAKDFTHIVSGKVEGISERKHFLPLQQCGDKENFSTLLAKVIEQQDNNIRDQSMGVMVSLWKLCGTLRSAYREHGHIVTQQVPIARKMGFPDVIMPDDLRNDLYVTIESGEFKKGNKTADKNMEVVMTVCNQSGEIIPNVIIDGAGGNHTNFYQSSIYYHDDKPKWAETVKISIPLADFTLAHLKFTFRHRSSTETTDRAEREKSYSLSYIRLMQDNGTTLADTSHTLNVYKVKQGPQNKVPIDESMHMQLPSLRDEVSPSRPMLNYGPFSLSQSDSFNISTLICSTKLTHNVNLMGLLKWRDHQNGLRSHLQAFLQVEGEEKVKFMHDILDALLAILMKNGDSDEFDNDVFNGLVSIICLVSDIKFHQFEPVLDLYIRENFYATLAYSKLTWLLKSCIERASQDNEHDMTRQALSSLKYIIRFIVRSRMNFAALHDDQGREQFERLLHQLFSSLNVLMNESWAQDLQIKTLENLPSCIDDLSCVVQPLDLVQLVVTWLTHVISHGKYMIDAMLQLMHTKFFQKEECRSKLISIILTRIEPMLHHNSPELSCCVDLLLELTYLLQQLDPIAIKEDVTLVVCSVLRPSILNVLNVSDKKTVNVQCVSLVVSLLKLMNYSEAHYQQYLQHLNSHNEVTDFLMELLLMIRHLVKQSIFPTDWFIMIVVQNSVFLRTIKFVGHVVQDKFSQPFEFQIWNIYFQTLIAFLTQETLQLEKFTATKKSQILANYGDMRREAGDRVRESWYNLGHSKIKFIPDLVGPILEMTLIPDLELRRATLPIFFDMMQCEFMSPCQKQHEYTANFHMFKQEIVIKLDTLVASGRGDEQFRELFTSTMNSKFENHQTMRMKGLAFVKTINELLLCLFEYHSLIDSENPDIQMQVTVNLLQFYQNIKQVGLYLRYVQKLSELHLENKYFTEAAATLQLYTDQLRWSDESLHPTMICAKMSSCLTHLQLKEKLHYLIIEYFDEGKMWEKAIETCKILAQQYEVETYSYKELSSILKLQASLFDKIMNVGHSINPEYYFRVSFIGQKAPLFFRNRDFIYRGRPFEPLADFFSRMLSQFSNAERLETLDEPTEKQRLSDKLYLLIHSVSPVMMTSKFEGKQVSQQIMDYYRKYEVKKFYFSRQSCRSNTDTASMWLERTEYETRKCLPGILRWSPIVQRETFPVSPMECAIETLQLSNNSLKRSLDRPSGQEDDRNLSMLLKGTIAANVNGGISNYKCLFEDNSNPALLEKLRDITRQQITLMHSALERHGKSISPSLQPLHAHLVDCFNELKQYVVKELRVELLHDVSISVPIWQSSTSSLNHSGGSRFSESPLRASSRSLFTEDKSSSSRKGSIVSISETDTPKVYGKKKLTQTPLNNSFEKKNDNAIELNQQLIHSRPPRPDSDRPRSSDTATISDSSSVQSLILPSDTPTKAAGNHDAVSRGSPPPCPEKQIKPPLPPKVSSSPKPVFNDIPPAIPVRIPSKLIERPPPPLPPTGPPPLAQILPAEDELHNATLPYDALPLIPADVPSLNDRAERIDDAEQVGGREDRKPIVPPKKPTLPSRRPLGE